MTNSYPNLDQIIVIIPVLNEEVTIAGVVQSLQSYGLKNILVVDNGSTDQSVNKAQAAGAQVIVEPTPGYGRACWRGLQQVSPDMEWVLFCDGDGSDDLSPLPQFFTKMADFDMILGNRRATAAGRKTMTAVQNFGNWLATFLIGLGWGHWYQDLGPLRLIRCSALEAIQMQDRGFGWTVEMQARAIECGLRVWELPVGYRRRQGGRSKISGTLSGSIQAGTVILSTLGRLYLRRWGGGEMGDKGDKEDKGDRRKGKNQRLFLWLSAFLLILGTALIVPYGDFRQIEAVPRFWLGIGIMSLGFVLSWLLRSVNAAWFWGVAILSRLLLLPMYPGDDIWRYLWEGYIQLQGFSPYELPPNAAELIPYRTEWWSLINHQGVTAIYPPITQLGFRILAAITPGVVLFKMGFVVADLLVCWLLSRRFGYQQTLIYAWNPLIIYSFAGGAHYDSWFILPLVAAWLVFDYSQQTIRWVKSALLLGISVAVKWMSLPILSFLVWRAWRQVGIVRAIVVMLCGFLPLGLTAIQFCHNGECPLIPTGSVFVSHGRSAELIPHLVSQIWEASRKVNWIYLFPLGLSGMWLLLRSKSFLQFSQWYFFVLLILSPIVHAWYFAWIVPFAAATGNWGVRLVSISTFIYFVLQYNMAQGNFDWYLTDGQRLWLWLPFLLGWFWSTIKFDSILTLWWQQARGQK
ncbi:MAG: glycosyltransferase [Symploca sp. SIO1A3]|nr:glycosyltransferase [Symploca sp. SIO1A3]